jgi:4-diphosphocytidyl-2C-methyl-D-erythritol kinase
MLTGSGSACFGFFSTPEEAEGAATAIPKTWAARGVALRPNGVARAD